MTPSLASQIPNAIAAPVGSAVDAAALAAGHWENVAWHWSKLGPPLRPSAIDIDAYLNAMKTWAASPGAPRALILGVTPELYHLPWPQGSHVLAIDRTQSMIDAVWPGLRGTVIRGDWASPPLPDACRDLVLCDGGFQLLEYPTEHPKLIRSLARIIAPGGLCIIRLFSPPAERESPDRVFQELFSRRIANLNLLKLRLGMALAEGPGQCVRLREVWDAINLAVPDFARLAEQIGWQLDHLLAINTYRDRHTKYFFLRIEQVRDLFCRKAGGFEFVRSHIPCYELGERCPILIFRRGT